MAKINFRSIGFCAVFSLSFALGSSAANANSKGKKNPVAPKPVLAPEVQWRQWYIHYMNGNPVGIFEEIFELRPQDNQWAILQNWQESEDGGTKTTIGSVSQKDFPYSPVAFFAERKSSKISYKIDARAKKDVFTLTLTPQNPTGPKIKREMPTRSGVILSNFLPLYLSQLPVDVKENTIETIVEDPRDGKFEVRAISITLHPDTKSFGSINCKKYSIGFNGLTGIWWVNNQGRLCQILIPSATSTIELATPEEAKAKFGNP